MRPRLAGSVERRPRTAGHSRSQPVDERPAVGRSPFAQRRPRTAGERSNRSRRATHLSRPLRSRSGCSGGSGLDSRELYSQPLPRRSRLLAPCAATMRESLVVGAGGDAATGGRGTAATVQLGMRLAASFRPMFDRLLPATVAPSSTRQLLWLLLQWVLARCDSGDLSAKGLVAHILEAKLEAESGPAEAGRASARECSWLASAPPVGALGYLAHDATLE
eukprot:SAG11_NODE_8549_length_1002_cov_1.085271_1_plen_219_part_10